VVSALIKGNNTHIGRKNTQVAKRVNLMLLWSRYTSPMVMPKAGDNQFIYSSGKHSSSAETGTRVWIQKQTV
jgi:hypothetical protein